ncbi:MAG: NnrS family protein [Sulfurospirillaceae bacterium]|nr:NnrS family protein [Sulfurospirillaceae bacterium]
MFKSWYTKFSSQPHQPFFTSGMIFLILFMSLLFGAYSHKLSLQVSVVDFHVYPMLFIIFAQFFLGFLFVVFPKFLMQAELSPQMYMPLFWTYLVGSLLFFVGLFTLSFVQTSGMFIVLIAQILSFYKLFLIQKKSLMKNKNDTLWILIAFASGIVSHILFFILSIVPNLTPVLQVVATNVGFYLFLFALIFTISQRMIPQFTGFKIKEYAINKTPYLVEIVYGLLSAKVCSVIFDHPLSNLLIDTALLILFTRELWRWKLPLFKVPAIIWILYLALLWIPIGFFFSTLIDLSILFWGQTFMVEKVVIHTFALGYFTTILIGFGTRVVLGHSGRTPNADKIAIALFIFLQLIVLIRLFASVSSNFGFDYIFWINHSALLLVFALFAWSIKYLWILIKGV